MTILRQIRKYDVIYTTNGAVKVERIKTYRIHREALNVLKWYWSNIAVNDR